MAQQPERWSIVGEWKKKDFTTSEKIKYGERRIKSKDE